MGDGTLPVRAAILIDWRGHKKGDTVTLTTPQELASAKSRPEVFNLGGTPTTAEKLVAAVVEPAVEAIKPKRRRRKSETSQEAE